MHSSLDFPIHQYFILGSPFNFAYGPAAVAKHGRLVDNNCTKPQQSSTEEVSYV